MRSTTLFGIVPCLVILAGCAAQSADAAETAEDADPGADAAAGGQSGAGGAKGSGGAIGTGGAKGSGGAIGTGGVKGSGGAIGTGGVKGSGGATGSGGAEGSGGAIGTGGATGSGGSGGGVSCGDAVASPLLLTPGVWTNITPPDPHLAGEEANDFVNDIQFDPSHPSTIYALNKGVQKSTDRGRTWQCISTFTLPQRIRIDPKNPDHLLTIQGVHASGFYATTDGGKTWDTPAGYTAILPQIGNDTDMYGMDVDPTDFGHFLLTHHWYWDGCQNGCTSGVVECFDGGARCVVHPAIPGVSGNGGYNVFFLYSPALGLGDPKTWLFMTQPGGAGEGYWRTTNAGESWTKVSAVPMIHGGSQLYYASDGRLYAAAWDELVRSSDNGASWSKVLSTSLFAVQGDGQSLYVIGANGGKFQTSKETSGTSWTTFDDQSQHTFAHSASTITYEPCNRILYAAMREDGAWALKLP